MSTYYSFYLGVRNDENKLEIAGPYYYSVKYKELRLGTLYETTGSFIEVDEFEPFMDNVPVEEIAEKDFKLLTDTGIFNKEVYSRAYACSLGAMARKAQKGNFGLYNGYCSFDEIDCIKTNSYCLDSRYDVALYSTDRVAEMPPADCADLGRAAFLALNDPAHQAHLISSAAENCLNYTYGSDFDRYCIIMVVG